MSEIPAIQQASRSLHKEEMSRFGDELPWLLDTAQIPEAIIGSHTDVDKRCFEVAEWMINRLGKWSGEGHSRLRIGETFEEQDLDVSERVALRGSFQKNPIEAYEQGILTMSEIFAAVPKVASNDNVPSDQWPMLARKAYNLGERVAQAGRIGLADFYQYLDADKDVVNLLKGAFLGSEISGIKPYRVLDANKLKLDAQSGITTVKPIADILNTDGEVVSEEDRVNCAALEATAPKSTECPHFFAAVWNAYADAAERFVYPNATIEQDKSESKSQSKINMNLPIMPESQYLL